MLDLPKVNAYVMAKQHLLPEDEGKDVFEVARDAVGLHATDPRTCYVALYSRMRNFKKEMLDTELRARTLVRIFAMRGTLFLFPRDIAPTAFSATRYERHTAANILREWDLRLEDIDAVKEAILTAFREKAMTSKQLHKAIPKGLLKTYTRTEGRQVYKWTNVHLLLRIMEHEGRIVSFKRPGECNIFGETLYSIPDLDLTGDKDARRKLVSWYLAAYGPVTLDDVAWWLNITKGEAQRLIGALSIESVTIDGLEREHFMLKDDLAKLKRFKGKPKGCVMLYYEDPYTKAYRHRQRLVDDEYDQQFYVGGSSMPCIMIDGRVVGVWRRSVIDIGARAFEKRHGTIVMKKAKEMSRFMQTLR